MCVCVCKFYTLKENLRIAEYGVVIANLSHDYREAVSYNLRKHKAWIELKMFIFSMKALVLLVPGGLQQACGPSCLDFL